MSPKCVVFIFFVIFSMASSERKYNTETFYINAKSTRLVNTQAALEYFVLNVGKPTLTVQIITGNVFYWKGAIAERVLAHGESYTFKFTGNANFMAVKVINNENINGFVHAYATTRGFSEFDEASIDFFKIDQHKLLQTVVVTGVSKIPVAGEALSLIVDFFWPEKEENIWQQVEDQVKELVDTRIQESIDGILGGAIEQFKTRIKTVLHEITNPNYTQTIGTHYVNIAEDLIGLERRFKFNGENSVNTNFYLLPLFATSVNLKLTLYQYGIKNWKMLRINKELIGRLTYYISELINNSASGAIAHVRNTCKDKLDKEYRDAYPETIYDQLSSVHAYCALNGLEHFPLWKSIAANPKTTLKKKPDVPVIVYSTQFGRNTAKQSAEMVLPSYQSLTPEIINGKLNIPVKITVFQTTNHLIAGMKVTAANGRIYYTGRTNNPKNKIRFEFDGKRLVKLIAKGRGQINGLHFIFEDGTIVRTGIGFGAVREFAMENHHIVGFYMTNSMTKINPDQAANIAVSYQVIMD